MNSAIPPIKKLFQWATPRKKRIYYFSEGSIDEKELLGNKGANLCEMVRLGLPVPQGFILTTEACKEFLNQEDTSELNSELAKEMEKSIHELEKETLKPFGATKSKSRSSQGDVLPLLLSIRSGASVSMPGMMDTILNLGMNEDLVKSMAQISNNSHWAYDTYRRFLQMFGHVVLGIEEQRYQEIIDRFKNQRGIEADFQLNESELIQIVQEFLKFTAVPHSPWEQLRMAVKAVFLSWNTPRAVKYRDINNISNDLGTAVTIQHMVYGNVNDESGSGVAFTRNPATGVKEIFGEYLPNAEGEDVVSGIRNPMKLTDLQFSMPKVFNALVTIENLLEKHYRDVQDIEFTVQSGILFILQTRKAKRTARASVKIAIDMVKEKLITEREALMRVEAEQMDQFLHPMIDPKTLNDPNLKKLTAAVAASSGSAQGKIVFTNEDAAHHSNAGQDCILCRPETSADDIQGLQTAKGVLTCLGGVTSHAAVVMRGMGKPAVTGARDLHIDLNRKELISKTGVVLHEGDVITLDGSSGTVFIGDIPLIDAIQDEDFITILQWADKYKNLHVLANADTPEEVQKALDLGAEGIGLCRMEHMFFQNDRLHLFRRMILSETDEERKAVLHDILPLLRQDFYEMIKLMSGLQVTIRLLDPPIHEFFPSPSRTDFRDEIFKMSGRLGISAEKCETRVLQLQEKNPMLGCRGCRLSIIHSDILEMQIRSIVGGALDAREEGIKVHLQIMIPLVFSDHELDCLTPYIVKIALEMCENYRCTLDDIGFELGAMIEVPRACIRADKIATAKHIKFLSIGSNDLTQLTFGLSRDDTQQFMPYYLEKHIVAHDPFKSLDFHAVGPLIHLAVKRSREVKPNIKIGLCGEHGADLHSVYFSERNNINYVSCSPYRIPTAKVAAAQSRIEFLAREQAKELEISRRMFNADMFLF